MIHYDFHDWPLVVVTTIGSVTMPEQAEFLQRAARCLSSGDRIAILCVLSEGAAVDSAEASLAMARDWLRAHEALIRSGMMGIALVATVEQRERMLHVDPEQLSGVPAQVFGDTSSALAFLRWFISPPTGATWDAGGIDKRVHATMADTRPVAHTATL
ncbi:hypothetical protein [Bordetella sp. N]|uniref:hypothetical protein n=1 Tax=Bordetella sp. N TaxID=1746199 RepID=UPI00070CA4B1|nr:hypothetical protein [Bordetella sp. N]ALM83645.1 hypothetical protein ASB57_12290 [Bordetella sp. N]